MYAVHLLKDVKDDTSSSADSDEDNEMETETSGGKVVEKNSCHLDSTRLITCKGGTIEDERVYLPGEPVPEGEELVYDRSAYQMYHAVSDNASARTGQEISSDIFFKGADWSSLLEL